MTAPMGTWFTLADVPGWQSKGVDADGVVWKVTALSGWDDPPDARAAFTDRPEADGQFDAPVFDSARQITWTGLVQAPDRATREQVKLTLGRIAAVLKAGADLVGHDDDGVDRTVAAKRQAGWKIAPFGPLGLQYQMAVTCVDPYKYGPLVSATTPLPTPGTGGLVFPLFDGTGLLEFGSGGDPGQVTLSNPGTADAFATFAIAGPVLGGLSLTDVDSGRQIVYGGDVPDGATLLIIDTAAGRATLNGADRTGELTRKQWFPVLAGESVTVQFAALGASGQAGTLTASLRPAYF